MQCPWVLACKGLVSLDLCGGIYVPRAVSDLARRQLAEMPLNSVVDGKVDGPCREVAKDGRSEPAVHATKAVMRDNVFDGR